MIKKFFQKLFLTKTYLESLTEKELTIGALSKSQAYDVAFSRGQLEGYRRAVKALTEGAGS